MRRKLFKDPDFPANNYSYSRRTDGRQKPPKRMVWKRPSEIRDRNPKFIASGYDQFDVDQGTNIYFFRKFLFIYIFIFFRNFENVFQFFFWKIFGCIYFTSTKFISARAAAKRGGEAPSKASELSLAPQALHTSPQLLKMARLKFWIFAFLNNFCPIKSDLFGKTVWPQTSYFQKLAKWTIFGILN